MRKVLWDAVWLKIRREEKGASNLFFLSISVFLIPLFFILALNISKAYLIKETVNRAADQAAFAAAATIYENVWDKTKDSYVLCVARDPESGECTAWSTFEQVIGGGSGEALKKKLDDHLPDYVGGKADVYEACTTHPDKCIITNAKLGLAQGRAKKGGVAGVVAQKNGSSLTYGPEERQGRGENGLPMVRMVVKTERGYHGTPVGDVQMGGDQQIEHVGYSYPIGIIQAIDEVSFSP